MEGTAALSKAAKDEKAWRDFKPGSWRDTIDVRDFIVRNATPYEGDEKFLAGRLLFESRGPFHGVPPEDLLTAETNPAARSFSTEP